MALAVLVSLTVLFLHQSDAGDGKTLTTRIKYPYFSEKVSSMAHFSRDLPLKAETMDTTRPITSVVILTTSSSVLPTAPDSTYTIIDVDLNENAGGKYIYLAYSNALSHGDPITGLQVFASYRSTFPAQNGFTKISNDLSEGAGGKYIYLYYTKNNENHPVYQVDVVAGASSQTYPPDDTWVRINQDTNEGAGGSYVYICYKKSA